MSKNDLTTTDVKLIEMLDITTLKLFNIDNGERMNYLIDKYYEKDNSILNEDTFSPLFRRKSLSKSK